MALTRPRAAQIYDIDYKQATRVITVANVTLAGGAPNQIDGVNLSLNDRVLVTGQSTASQNGIYYVTTLGSGANGTWTRSLDTDATGELLAGTIVMVTEGTVYHDTQWKLTTNDPIVIGTTPLTFEQNSAFAFGNVYANGTAVLATSVGDVLTLTAGNNIQITGNNTAKSVTIGVTGISLTSIANGTSNVNVLSSGGNVSIGIGGTSNVAVFSTTGEYVTGILSATGNVTGGNVSTAGNVTGSYLKGNASQVTGINTFNQIFVTGTNTINASGLTSNVTFTAGNNISLTSVSNVITIAYSASGGGSIFATGGDMGLISQPVTASEDLGNVTTLADTSYDLGTLFSTVTYNQIDMTGFTSNINTGNLNAVGLANIVGNINGSNITTVGLISATGNVTGGNLIIAVDAYIGNATGIPTATLHLAAGSNTANTAPLKFTAGPTLTTAEAGVMEFNGNALYFSTAAGNRGVIPTPYFYRTGANRVLSNVTTGQSWLGVGVTLQANTTYQFTGQFYITTTDTASHVEQIGFGGTATLANIFYQVVRANAVTGTPNATTSSATQYFIANTLANTTAAVAVAANSVYTLNGTVSTNATGTFIPQWAANATTTGNTATVVSGAYFSISPVASGNGIISIGTWA